MRETLVGWSTSAQLTADDSTSVRGIRIDGDALRVWCAEHGANVPGEWRTQIELAAGAKESAE